MPRADRAAEGKELTLEERRERRQLRREKQRADNIGRAAKMHTARLKMETESPKHALDLKSLLHVGCSGWRYWKWRDSFYANVPQDQWFAQYLKRFVLLVADSCECPGMAAPTRQETVRLHRQGL